MALWYLGTKAIPYQGIRDQIGPHSEPGWQLTVGNWLQKRTKSSCAEETQQFTLFVVVYGTNNLRSAHAKGTEESVYVCVECE